MEEEKSKKPKNSAFKQQRLKAWQPILTPKSVIPTFFVIGVVFIPLGIGLYITSQSVHEIIMDYTQCSVVAPSVMSNENVPSNVNRWSFDPTTSECVLEFDIPTDFKDQVFLYYRMTNYYQNHRRYVQSFDSSQLRGQALPASVVSSSCSPIDSTVIDGTTFVYYPCGLIANSLFNDTFSNLTGTTTFVFSEKGIAWPSDAQKYKMTTYSVGTDANQTYTEIIPPPNWISYGTRYTAANIPDLSQDEHFQVWMRTAGLPTFRKLYGKAQETLPQGTYNITIKSIYDVASFGGTKSVVISTVSWMGGKNPFLGIAYMTVGSLCFALGITFLVKHLISPRKLGDHQYLKWN